jgi:uncharacterized protein (TIGR03083 family)
MVVVPPSGHPVRSIVEAAASRSASVAEALSDVSPARLAQPSLLPGWTRLTIACHLRYGAEALLRMTQAGIAGERAAYYPRGRGSQRPLTLAPAPGEDPQEVVDSLSRLSRTLGDVWSSLDTGAWDREVSEPADNPDLGTVPLSGLPLLRLTELEVHGSDLDLGLDDWSDAFVRAALPARLAWLNSRRTNHREFAPGLRGTWLLVATDGPTFMVAVTGDIVDSHPSDARSSATAVLEGSSRDLLALLLGRPGAEPLHISGDRTFGESFQAAFPGP